MLASLAVVSLLSTAAFAQSSSSLIPSGISSSCESFLTSLDSNSTIESCISPMLQATQAYAPGSSSTPSASNMATICGTESCPDATLRSLLASFASACSAEITSNSQVITLYDIIYLISPMTTAMCSKGDSGSYCALSATSTSSSAAASASSTSVAAAAGNAQQYLATSSGTLNNTAFTDNNVLFMFLTSNLASSQCNSCTRNIMTSYIDWESDTPYAPSLSNSQLLSGQSPLYNAITSTCGSSFLSGVVQAAGGLGTGSSNGSLKSMGFDIRTFAVAFVSMVMASVL